MNRILHTTLNHFALHAPPLEGGLSNTPWANPGKPATR
jgi:hypothetical protein